MTTQFLNAHEPMVDSQGRPTRSFLKMMQQTISGVVNTMPGPAPVTVLTDYTGAILSTELPKVVTVRRLFSGNDISPLAAWKIAVAHGTITATIDNGGNVSITAFSSPTAVLQVRSDYNGVPLFCNILVSKAIGNTPATGPAGGGSSTCTSFNSINSASHAVITTSALIVTVGASGQVNLTAPLTVSTANAAPQGTYPVFGKWQFSTNSGSTWTDVAAEVQSNPDCFVEQDVQDLASGPRYTYICNNGTLTVNVNKTGIAAGTVWFQLLARNGSGTRVMTFSGTASAVPQ